MIRVIGRAGQLKDLTKKKSWKRTRKMFGKKEKVVVPLVKERVMGMWLYIFDKKRVGAEVRDYMRDAHGVKFNADDEKKDEEILKEPDLNQKYGFTFKSGDNPFEERYYNPAIVKLPRDLSDIRFCYDIEWDLLAYPELSWERRYYAFGGYAQDEFIKLQEAAQENLKYLKNELSNQDVNIPEWKIKSAIELFELIIKMPHDEVFFMGFA